LGRLQIFWENFFKKKVEKGRKMPKKLSTFLRGGDFCETGEYLEMLTPALKIRVISRQLGKRNRLIHPIGSATRVKAQAIFRN